MDSPAQSPNYPTTQPPHLFSGVWMLVLAGILLSCGLCSGIIYLLFPFTEKNAASALQTNTVTGAAAGLGILLAALLTWQGVGALRNHTPIPAARVFPPLLGFVLAFVGAILLGVGALLLSGAETSLFAAYLFPPWHFVAAVSAPLAILAYAAHRLGADSGLRALVTAFVWGALGASTIAIIIELLIAGIFLVIAVIFLMLNPPSRIELNSLLAQLQTGRQPDATAFLKLFSNPLIAVAALIYFGFIVPPVEEAFKALVVAFANPLKTRLADAVLWGMSAGAGFAVLENLFNASMALTATTWAAIMFLRIGATTMHVSNGAMMGFGWHAARVEGRWKKLATAYGASVLYHAIWNCTAVVLSASALFLAPSASGPFQSSLPLGILAAVLGITLMILTMVGWMWIFYSVGMARKT